MLKTPNAHLNNKFLDIRQKVLAHSIKMSGTMNRPKGMEYFDEISLLACNPNNLRSLIGATARDKVIGTFCTFVPEELIVAAGAKPIRLDLGLPDTVGLGERYLPRIFCPALKSLIGFLMLSSEKPDIFIIPTVCDGKKKFYDALTEYVPTWILGVPHTTGSVHAKQFWLTEFRNLKKRLEDFTGTKIDEGRLKRAMDLYNRRRRALRRLYETRKVVRPPISGRDVLEVMTTLFHDNPKRWTYHVEKLCEELESNANQGVGVCDAGTPRIMLAGSPIIPPNWKIPDVVEETGAIIVTDELCTGVRGNWYLAETTEYETGDMVKTLADRYLMCECACFAPNYERIDRIVKTVKDYGIDGVLYHVLIACHTFNIEATLVEAALKKMGVPMLKIETDYAEEDIEQVRTRVEAFLEMIRRKKVNI